MAAKAPTKTKSATGYVDASRGVYGLPADGSLASSEVYSSNGLNYFGRENLRLSIWYFSDIDDADVWDTTTDDTLNPKPPKGCVSAAWQPDDVDADMVAVAVTGPQALLFNTGSSNLSGWVWVLSRS